MTFEEQILKERIRKKLSKSHEIYNQIKSHPNLKKLDLDVNKTLAVVPFLLEKSEKILNEKTTPPKLEDLKNDDLKTDLYLDVLNGILNSLNEMTKEQQPELIGTHPPPTTLPEHSEPPTPNITEQKSPENIQHVQNMVKQVFSDIRQIVSPIQESLDLDKKYRDMRKNVLENLIHLSASESNRLASEVRIIDNTHYSVGYNQYNSGNFSSAKGQFIVANTLIEGVFKKINAIIESSKTQREEARSSKEAGERRKEIIVEGRRAQKEWEKIAPRQPISRFLPFIKVKTQQPKLPTHEEESVEKKFVVPKEQLSFVDYEKEEILRKIEEERRREVERPPEIKKPTTEQFINKFSNRFKSFYLNAVPVMRTIDSINQETDSAKTPEDIRRLAQRFKRLELAYANLKSYWKEIMIQKTGPL